MKDDDDRDLGHAFKALGTQARMTLPSFQQLTSRASVDAARWRHRRRRAAMLAFAIVIPVLVAQRVRQNRGFDYEQFTALTGIDLREVTWDAPSDFLLDTPGRDLLRVVPLIDLRMPAPAPGTDSATDANDTTRGFQ